MRIVDVVTPERVRRLSEVSSRKRLLEQVANMLASAKPALTAGEILDALRSRERLGSTAVGGGAAIPRARIAGLDTPLGAFVQLATGLDYGTGESDAAWVDRVFALIVPENTPDDVRHFVDTLGINLAAPRAAAELRSAIDDTALYAVLRTLDDDT